MFFLNKLLFTETDHKLPIGASVLTVKECEVRWKLLNILYCFKTVYTVCNLSSLLELSTALWWNSAGFTNRTWQLQCN